MFDPSTLRADPEEQVPAAAFLIQELAYPSFMAKT
jgi:hypothetical protein